MGFQIPQYLKEYLSTKNSSPTPFWVNTSQYYAGLSSYYINYMNYIVRKCMAYACGVKDGGTQNSIGTNVGYAIKQTAVKLIKGDRVIFNGDDIPCRFLDDIWSKKSRFNRFLEEAIDYTLSGGTCAIKLNVDAKGRSSLSATRIDRYYATTTDNGDVVDAIFFVTLISREKAGAESSQYWLVEHRYIKEGIPFVVYKVHMKSGTAGSDVLPVVDGKGIPRRSLGTSAQAVIDKMGIKLNEPMILPFKNGIGVWQMQRTATNSCVPGANLGDPLLFGVEDLLWAVDTVFSGSVIDVLNGEGKILVPKKFLVELKDQLGKAGLNVTERQAQHWGDNDDSLVYISVEHDKDFPPQSVQFEIRSTQYREMFEVYLRQIVAHSGFAPTSVFPFLADNSARTATEVTAEENLTRATIQAFHALNLPVIDEALEEVLYLEGFGGQATVQLSDYIGNKIQRDANLRANYEAGALPQETFVQKINGISAKETKEYCDKINAERKLREGMPFNGIEDIVYE